MTRDLQTGPVVALADQFGELRRSRDVRALTDIHEPGQRANCQRLEATQAAVRLNLGPHARRQVGHRVGDCTDMPRCGAATATHDVDEPALGEFSQLLGHVGRSIIISTEFVGQPGIGVHTDRYSGHTRQFLNVGAKCLGTESAIETHRYRFGMCNRIPKRLRCLT